MAFVAALADHLKSLALAGDVECASVASEALARILETTPAAGAAVIDLASARRASPNRE